MGTRRHSKWSTVLTRGGGWKSLQTMINAVRKPCLKGFKSRHPGAVIRFHTSSLSPNFVFLPVQSTNMNQCLNMHADRKLVYQNSIDNQVQPRSREQGQTDMLGCRPLQPSQLPLVPRCRRCRTWALSPSDCVVDAADCIHVFATRRNY